MRSTSLNETDSSIFRLCPEKPETFSFQTLKDGMEVARKRCRLGSVYVIEEPMVWDLEDVIKFLENAMS